VEFSKFLKLEKIREYSINSSISKDLVYIQSCDFCRRLWLAQSRRTTTKIWLN